MRKHLVDMSNRQNYEKQLGVALCKADRMADKRLLRNLSNSHAHAKGHKSALLRPGKGKRGAEIGWIIHEGLADDFGPDCYMDDFEWEQAYAEFIPGVTPLWRR